MDSKVYAVGDIHGCFDEWVQLLAQLPCDASVICVGDVVNRGPQSLAVLRFLKNNAPRIRMILGNHDLHLLARAAGLRPAGPRDTLTEILTAPDREELLQWLRQQPLALQYKNFLCVHAGILPQWTSAEILSLAAEIETKLRSPDYLSFLAEAFSPHPLRWQDAHSEIERLRFGLNMFTRLRFCTASGRLDLSSKGKIAPTGYLPWFKQKAICFDEVTVVFGHWSMMGLVLSPGVIGVDTGCVWGGSLSAISLTVKENRQLFQIKHNLVRRCPSNATSPV